MAGVVDKLPALRRRAAWYLARWAADPLAFVMEACNAKKNGAPTAFQAEALRLLPLKRKIAIRSGHGVGKTRLCAWIFWWMMVTQKRADHLKVPCTGPSGANLSDVLWSEVSLVRRHLHPFFADRFQVMSDSAVCVERPKEWFASLRTARKENPDALQGFHGDPMLFIIDEGSGVPDEVFEVARGAMSGPNTYAIMFGNPVRLSGYFYRAFHARKSPWATLQVSCLDNLAEDTQRWHYLDAFGGQHCVEVPGRVSRQYCEGMEEEFGKYSPTYKARVLGDFPVSETDQVIPARLVKAAAGRPLPEEEDKSRRRIVGVDVAYQGTDSSAYVVRRGGAVEEVARWHGNDPTETAERVRARCVELGKMGKPVDYICVDATGIGMGVYSNLKHAGMPAVPVLVSESCPEDGGTKCRRLRDWLWWKARLYFLEGSPVLPGASLDSIDTAEVDSDMSLLAQQLTVPQYRYGISGRVEIETKGELRKRKSMSPDLADAFCLTFYVDSPQAVVPPKTGQAHWDWYRARKRGRGGIKIWRVA